MKFVEPDTEPEADYRTMDPEKLVFLKPGGVEEEDMRG